MFAVQHIAGVKVIMKFKIYETLTVINTSDCHKNIEQSFICLNAQ